MAKRRDLLAEAREAGDSDRAYDLLARAVRGARSERRRSDLRAELRTRAQRDRNAWRWRFALQSYELWLSIGPRDEDLVLAELLNDYGWALCMVERHADGERECQRALVLQRAAGRDGAAANTLYTLAEISFQRGALADAELHAREALALGRVADGPRALFYVYGLARILSERGEDDEAFALARQGEAEARERNVIAILGNFTNMLANFTFEDGRITEAEPLYETARVHFQRYGLRDAESLSTQTLGSCAFERDDLAAAVRWLDAAKAIPRTTQLDWFRGLDLTIRGQVERERGALDDAQRALDEAVAIAVRLGHRPREAFVRCALARLAEARGHLDEARAHYAEAEIALGTRGGRVLAHLVCALAGLDAERRDFSGAMALLDRAGGVELPGVGRELANVLLALAGARAQAARALEARPDAAAALRERVVEALAETAPWDDRSAEVRRVRGRIRALLPS